MKNVSSNTIFEKITSLNSKFVKSAEPRLVFLYSFFTGRESESIVSPLA